VSASLDFPTGTESVSKTGGAFSQKKLVNDESNLHEDQELTIPLFALFRFWMQAEPGS